MRICHCPKTRNQRVESGSSCHCCEGREWVVSALYVCVWEEMDVQCGSHMYVYATRTAHPLRRLRSGEKALFVAKTHNKSLKAEAVGTVRVCFAVFCSVCVSS